jgi:DoxX-like protein
MSSDSQSAPSPKWMVWVGWILSVLPAPLLVMSAFMKFAKSEEAIKGFSDLGWKEEAALTLGIIEIACTVLYLFPRTAVLGAILLTGYLGGAVATHLRVNDPLIRVLMPVILGVVIWGGIWLRDARLRALAPLRS